MSEPERWYQPAETVILTGAGFTKTFGGFLGDEMWSAIFNQPEVQSDAKIRECMLEAESLNYEAVYEDIMNSGKYSSEQKAAVTSALRRAYREMDDNICQVADESAHACRFFLAQFVNFLPMQERIFFFTLNQDLFIERFYTEYGDTKTALRLPSLETKPEWFKGNVGFKVGAEYQILLPNEAELEKKKERFWEKGTGQFMYVKLHGSHGWKSKDGSDAMIIGHGKKGRIKDEPLLRWYLSLFEEVLTLQKRKLVVIGYGFMDDHINEVIAKAVKNNGLRLYPVYPKAPKEFRDHLIPLHGFNVEFKKACMKIWEGLGGYESCKITDLYDPRSTIIPPRGQAFLRRLGL